MELFITFFLMSFVIAAGSLANISQNGTLNPSATEPFKSQQSITLAVSFGLAAVVPFWREHYAITAVSFGLAALFLIQGVWGLWAYEYRTALLEKHSEGSLS